MKKKEKKLKVGFIIYLFTIFYDVLSTYFKFNSNYLLSFFSIYLSLHFSINKLNNYTFFMKYLLIIIYLHSIVSILLLYYKILYEYKYTYVFLSIIKKYDLIGGILWFIDFEKFENT